MDDTSPEIKQLMLRKMMALSGEERLRMGARSFEAARTMALASFPPGLSQAELRRRLYERFYGPMEPALWERIKQAFPDTKESH